MGIIRIYIITANTDIIRELTLDISHPAKGKDTREPIVKPNHIVPNSASLNAKLDLKSGIRVAHVAKFNPHNKNKIPILIRFLIKLIIEVTLS
jgi:hypothetical protein